MFDSVSLDDPPLTLPDAASPRCVVPLPDVPLPDELCDQAFPPMISAPLNSKLEIATVVFRIYAVSFLSLF
jgi:hypothetical protein